MKKTDREIRFIGSMLKKCNVNRDALPATVGGVLAPSVGSRSTATVRQGRDLDSSPPGLQTRRSSDGGAGGS